MRRWQTEVRVAVGGLLALVVGATALVPAPAGAADTTAYITSVAPHAQREASQYGVPASVAIAQSVLESGWGASTLTTQGKNYFGIKCQSNGDPAAAGSPYVSGCLAKPSYEYPGPVLITSYFRTYASAQNSFLDHGYLLSTRTRYAAAFRYTTNPDQFVREVAAAGYATDPSYADLVVSIMKSYNLYRFDSVPRTTTPATSSPAPSSSAPRSTAPVVSTTAPVVSTSAPRSTAPVVSSSAPKSSAPVVSSSAPSSTAPSSSAPVVSSSAPKSTAPSSSAPVVSSSAPSSSVPVVSSVPSSAAPVVSSAAVTTAAPTSAAAVPTSTSPAAGVAPTTLTGLRSTTQPAATRTTTSAATTTTAAATTTTQPAGITPSTARLAWAHDRAVLRRAWRAVLPRGFAARWSWFAQEW